MVKSSNRKDDTGTVHLCHAFYSLFPITHIITIYCLLLNYKTTRIKIAIEAAIGGGELMI